MGTLVIRIPEDVNAECEISDSESLTCRQRSFMKNIRQVKPMIIWTQCAGQQRFRHFGN